MATKPLPRAFSEGDYPAIVATVAAMPGWTPEVAQQAHMVLVAWTERALASRNPANWRVTHDLVQVLRTVHGEASLDAALPGTSGAWRGFEAVLRARVARVCAEQQLCFQTLQHALDPRRCQPRICK